MGKYANQRYGVADGFFFFCNVYICCLQETSFISKHTLRLKVRVWENVFSTNGNKKNVAQKTCLDFDWHCMKSVDHFGEDFALLQYWSF